MPGWRRSGGSAGRCGGVKPSQRRQTHDWNLWTLHRRLVLAVPPPGCCLWAHQPRAQTGYPRHPASHRAGARAFGFDSVLGIDYFYGIPDALRQSGAKVAWAGVGSQQHRRCGASSCWPRSKHPGLSGLQGQPDRPLAWRPHHSLCGGRGAPARHRPPRWRREPGPRVAETSCAAWRPRVGQRNGGEHRRHRAGGPDQPASGGTGPPQMPTAALDLLTTQGSAHQQPLPQGVPPPDCGSGAELVKRRALLLHGPAPKRPDQRARRQRRAARHLSWTFGEANDGLVSACSSRLGKHLGDYRQNHLDEVNQMVGLRDWFSAPTR